MPSININKSFINIKKSFIDIKKLINALFVHFDLPWDCTCALARG